MQLQLYDMAITVIALLFTIVAHEVAHGTMALLMGDTTARDAGRLTPNPLKHLDPVGTLSMILFRFGWAKPVPINPYRFRNRKLGMILVSGAGAAVNLLIAFLCIAFLGHLPFRNAFLDALLQMLLIYNIYFAVFNLLPVPPLDGSKILFTLLPDQLESFFYRYEQYFNFLLIALLISGLAGRVVVPIAQMIMDWMIRIAL